METGGAESSLVLNSIDKARTCAETGSCKAYPYIEEEVAYENKAAGVKLAGTLTLPVQKDSFPPYYL